MKAFGFRPAAPYPGSTSTAFPPGLCGTFFYRPTTAATRPYSPTLTAAATCGPPTAEHPGALRIPGCAFRIWTLRPSPPISRTIKRHLALPHRDLREPPTADPPTK